MLRLTTLCLFILSGLPTFAFASYLVQPPIIEHTVEPRDMHEDTIRVTNQTGTTIKIFPSVHNVTLGIDGTIASFTSPVMTDQTTNVSSWLAISRARVELGPFETIRIPLSLTVNPQAVPGDYYAFIGFGSGDKRDEAESAVLGGGVPGTIVRISVADTKNEYLRLNGFFTTRYVTDPSTAQFTYELENSGDTPITPTGEIIIYDVTGAEIGSVPVNPDGRTIAPREQQVFLSELPDTNDFGKHKAFLNIRYGENQTANLYDTTFYTLIPWSWLVAIGVTLVLICLILAWLLTRSRTKTVYQDEYDVPLYIRPGELRDRHERDVNLKHE